MESSKKRLHAFDLDGTLFNGNSSLAFANFCYRKGAFSLLQYLRCLTIALRYYLGADLSSIHRLAFTRLFKGRKFATLIRLAQEFASTLSQDRFYKPALELLQQALAKKEEVWILSSAPLFLVEPIACHLGVSCIKATQYLVDKEGSLCDIEDLVTGTRKAHLLHDSGYEQTIAYSDSIEDLPFLQAATEAVAVKPSKKLLASFAAESIL